MIIPSGLDLAITLAGFAAFILPVTDIIFSKKDGVKWYNKITLKGWAILLTGLLVMVLAFKKSTQDEAAAQTNKQITDSLRGDVKQISQNLADKIKQDSLFYKYLKDSLGIQVIDITTNNVTLTNTYYTLSKKEVTPNLQTISAAQNYGYRLSRNKDTVMFFPQTGVWIKPFFSFDATLETKNEGIFQSDGMSQKDSRLPPEQTVINNKVYKTYTVYMSIVRSKSNPMVLDISADKNQYLIFGDAADPEKRYFFKDGKVIWSPKTD